jgi:hypothetical protein
MAGMNVGNHRHVRSGPPAAPAATARSRPLERLNMPQSSSPRVAVERLSGIGGVKSSGEGTMKGC